MVAPVAGVTAVNPKCFSAATAGPRMSPSVSGRGIAHVGEQVAAEERARRLLVHQPRVPAVRHVRGVEAPHAPAAEVDHLAVGERARRAGGLVVEPDGAADGAVGDGGGGGGVEPLAERAALVGLDVAERDPAQPAQVGDPRRRQGDRGEQGALAAVEQERLVGVDQELVEGEPARPHLRHEGGEAVDPLGDLVDPRVHRSPPGRCPARGVCPRTAAFTPRALTSSVPTTPSYRHSAGRGSADPPWYPPPRDRRRR